jgi:hypothetical protein
LQTGSTPLAKLQMMTYLKWLNLYT